MMKKYCSQIRSVTCLIIFWSLSCTAQSALRATDRQSHPTKRIVSLAPNLTELIAYIEGTNQLVGRSASCNYPPEVKTISIGGNFGQPFLEPILSLRPTLVLITEAAHPQCEQLLQNTGVPVKKIETAHIDDIPRAMRTLGSLLGQTPQAEAKANAFEAAIEQFRCAPAAPHAINVLVLVSQSPLITVGSDSFLAEMLSLAGARNLGSVRTQAYYSISAEWIYAVNPDYILLLTPHDNSISPALLPLEAIKRGRYSHPAQEILDTICRPGPRIPQGIAALKQLFLK